MDYFLPFLVQIFKNVMNIQLDVDYFLPFLVQIFKHVMKPQLLIVIILKKLTALCYCLNSLTERQITVYMYITAENC